VKGPLKWIAAIVGVIVLLFVSAAILLPIIFDPNDHKAEIIAQVKEQTGRDLRIDGDISLTVFPWIGVEIGKVALSNAAGFDDTVFASTDKVSIRVKLLPLFSKRLEMDTVTVHGLTLNLARDAGGRSNWDDLAKAGGDAGSSQQSTSSDAPGASDGSAAVALAIGGLDIKDANLSWKDASSGQRFKIANLTIQTGAISSGEPVDLKLALDVQAGESDVSRHITVEGKLDYDAGNKSLLVEDLQFEAEDLKVTGQFRVDNLDSAPTAMGTISVAEFNPKKLLGAFSEDTLQTRDPDALTRLSLQAAIAAKPNQLTVKPLTIHLDESTLTGEVTLPDLASQALRFKLALDAIDADRYMMPPEKGESGDGASVAATPGAAATAASGEVPNDALRRLDVAGRMTIGKLKVASLNLSDVEVSVNAKNGVIRLHPVDANLYGGTYRGNITVDVRGDSPRTSVDENLVGVLAGPLLQDLQGHDRITGKANVNIAMRSVGATADEVKRSLNGSATFAFTDGAINGVNVARMIREAYARIKGAKLPAEEVEQQTDFSELRGSMHVKDGVATNNDFLVSTPLLRINGKGTANLPAETVDYRVAATIVTTLKGQGGEELKDLVGIPIPIHVTGKIADPTYALDTDALAQALAKSKVQDMIDEKIGDDAVKGLLKGLFK
jgi:AsmA protein